MPLCFPGAPLSLKHKIQLASLQLATGNSHAVINTIGSMQNSSDPRVHAILGEAEYRLGQFTDAMSSFQKAIQASAGVDNDFLKQELGAAAFDFGDSDTALRNFRDLQERSPGQWKAAVPLISVLMQQGKTAEALDLVNRTAKGGTRTPLAPYYRGRVLAAADDLAGASKAFSEALAINPRFQPALYFRAHVEVARGDTAMGKKDLQQLIAQNPSDTSAWLALAQIAVHEDDKSGWNALLNNALKSAPKDPAPRLALATGQTFQRKYADAESTLNALLKVWPGNPQALTQLGRVQLLKGDKVHAVETYRGLVAASPNSSGAYMLLAKIFHATNDPVGAIDAAQKAVELSPLSVHAHALLVEYLAGGGKTEEAIASAKQYASGHPSPESDLLVASALARSKRERDAYEYLQSRFAATRIIWSCANSVSSR